MHSPHYRGRMSVAASVQDRVGTHTTQGVPRLDIKVSFSVLLLLLMLSVVAGY